MGHDSGLVNTASYFPQQYNCSVAKLNVNVDVVTLTSTSTMTGTSDNAAEDDVLNERDASIMLLALFW